MKKITIFIGCWVNQLIYEIKFFSYLKKKLKCKITRKSKFVFNTKINGAEVTFRLCYGPDNDLVWKARKKRSLKKGKPLSPSIAHIAQEEIKADEIYYLGFCGIFKGEKNQIFLPNKFVRVSFPEYKIHKEHIENMRVSKPINYSNTLIGLVREDKCTTLTSNQLFALKAMVEHSPEILAILVKKAKKYADVVEMENYEIVKRFGKTHPIGILLFGTDIPGKKGHQIGQTNKFNWRRFNKVGAEVIKKITI